MKNSKGLHDGLLIIFFLVLAFGSYFLFVFRNTDEGSFVDIQVDGVTIATLSMEENAVYEYLDGDEKNVIVVEDGTVYISEANCTNHHCVLQGKIKYRGETIVCIPHKLVVSITGKSDGELDGMVR